MKRSIVKVPAKVCCLELGVFDVILQEVWLGVGRHIEESSELEPITERLWEEE